MMKNQKSKTIIFTIVIVSLLVFSSVSSLGITTKSSIDDESCGLTVASKTSVICLKTSSHAKIKSKLISKTSVMGILSESNESDSELKVIANTTYDEYYPSIISKGYDALIAYEAENETGAKNVYIKNSNNFGANWSEEVFCLDINLSAVSPSFTSLTKGNDDAFGACITPDNTSYIYEIPISDLGSINEYELTNYRWDYSDVTFPGSNEHMANFHNLQKLDVAGYPNSEIPWIISSVGDATFVEGYEDFDCQGSPVFFFKDPDDSNYRTIVFFPEVKNCSNMSLCVGKDGSSTATIYGSCEIQNGSSHDLLFFHGNVDLWTDEETSNLPLITQTFTSDEDLFHPKITTMNNHVYIASETNSNGIILYHSANYGAEGSWSIANVTADILPSGANPKNPSLFSNETHLSCLFTYLGNLSLTKSAGNGVSWDTPEQINDENGSVVNSYRFTDMQDPNYIAWTDNRDGNYDIYCKAGEPPEIDLEIQVGSINLSSDMPFIFAKNTIQFSIRNNGPVDLRDILVNVTYECDGCNPVTISYPSCIGQINAGTNETYTKTLFKLTLTDFVNGLINFAGIQNITVIVDPEGETGDVDMSNNAVTYGPADGLSFEYMFPRLYILEPILKMLKPQES